MLILTREVLSLTGFVALHGNQPAAMTVYGVGPNLGVIHGDTVTWRKSLGTA